MGGIEFRLSPSNYIIKHVAKRILNNLVASESINS